MSVVGSKGAPKFSFSSRDCGALLLLCASVSNAANVSSSSSPGAGGHWNARRGGERRREREREKIVGELRGVMRGLRVVTFCVSPASSQTVVHV